MGMRLQRDSEVGVLSGEYERAGFYGKEFQLFGFLCDEDKQKMVVSDDDLEVALSAYLTALEGKPISMIKSYSERLYGTEQEVEEKTAQVYRHFKENLCKEALIKPMERGQVGFRYKEKWEKKHIAHCISGFSYLENGRQKSQVNAYFLQTVTWWMEKLAKGMVVSEIVIAERQSGVAVAQQLRQLKTTLQTEKMGFSDK